MDKNLTRIVITNEMFYAFDVLGDIKYKFSPLEVIQLKYKGNKLSINSLEFNNNHTIELYLADEMLNLESC